MFGGESERSLELDYQAQQRWQDQQWADHKAGRNAPAADSIFAGTAPPPAMLNPMANPYMPGGYLYSDTTQPAVTPGQNPNVFNVAGQAYNQGTAGLSYASNPLAPVMSMNMFLNPYRQMVLSDTLARQRDDMAQNLNMVQGQANQARAFGGARHGLVEAELMDRYNRNAGETAARVMQQGFDLSANLGLQGLSQTRIGSQALMSSAPVGFNLGNTAMGNQMQAGGMQQGMLQQILNAANDGVSAFGGGPTQQLRTALMGAQGNPLANRSQTTEQFNPGLLQYMQFGAGLMGGK